jgi:putative ABC transport system permease protein
VVNALGAKSWRDLFHLKGQVLTIALVIAAGIASYTSLQSCYRSLLITKSDFYAQQRFADVFVNLERAPRSLVARLEALPGVLQVYDHIVDGVTVPVDTFPEPALGHVVSIPDHGAPLLNAVQLRRGRWPEPDRPREVVLLESFAKPNGIRIGMAVPVVLNQRLQRLQVVGLGVAPEYVFPVQGGPVTPDAQRFGVFWMRRQAAAAAFDLQGAFNAVAFSLQPEAATDAVIDAIDDLLEPYGGRGAYAVEDQPSNARLEGEFLQLRAFATVLPAMFLGVAALLLNIVLSRLVLLQRTQIATLKALGYDNRQVGLHYVLTFASTLALGSVLGTAGGAWLGRAMTDLYLQYFRLPSATFVLEPQVVLIAVVTSGGAGLLGAVMGMRSVVRLPPAEAMRPSAPARYRLSLIERLGLRRHLPPTAMMVVREIERRPLRTGLSSLAIAAAISILVAGRYSGDATDHILETTLQSAWREDLYVELERPVPVRDVGPVRHFPGVQEVETQRSVPVRFRAGHREKDGLLLAYEDDARLRRPMTTGGLARTLPAHGVLLTEHLAAVLGLAPGDWVHVKSYDETRPTFELQLMGVVDEPFGLVGHVRLDELAWRQLEEPRVNAILLNVDPDRETDIVMRLKDVPAVRSILRRKGLVNEFREQTAGMLRVTMIILSIFASCIVVGVVYNNARVSLSMRSRDLATMRVLGFHRSEISAILLGELAVQVALAIPVGLWLGIQMCNGISATVDPDEFRLPVILTSRTYGFSIAVTLAASAFAALLVRRRLDRLDLVQVLKSTESS